MRNGSCLKQGIVIEARTFYLVKNYDQYCSEVPDGLGKQRGTSDYPESVVLVSGPVVPGSEMLCENGFSAGRLYRPVRALLGTLQVIQ
tara:strand:+ start:2311 stop:2574 length:264 start_codon:yes stop_codon:yes gene_type:complete